MEIKKIENCNYVMFPRLQHCGLKPEHVNRVHNGDPFVSCEADEAGLEGCQRLDD